MRSFFHFRHDVRRSSSMKAMRLPAAYKCVTYAIMCREPGTDEQLKDILTGLNPGFPQISRKIAEISFRKFTKHYLNIFLNISKNPSNMALFCFSIYHTSEYYFSHALIG